MARPSGKTALFGSVFITLLAGTGLIIAAAIGRPIPTSVAPSTLPITALGKPVESKLNQPASFEATLSKPQQVDAGTAQGTITNVFIAAGDEIAQGTKVFEVNGTPVWAFISETPLYRDFTWGIKGKDVEGFQEFLGTVLERELAVTGVMDRATLAAVKDWQKMEGLPQTSIAEQSLFVWLDADTNVNSVNLALGKAAPTGSMELFTKQGGAHSLAVNSGVTTPGDYTLIAHSTRVNATLTDAGRWQLEQGKPLNDFLTAAQPLTAEGTVNTSNKLTFEGRVELRTPITGVSLPASSVISSSSSATVCLWEPNGIRVDGATIIDSSSTGAVILSAEPLVDGRSLVGSEFLVDPTNSAALSPADLTCP